MEKETETNATKNIAALLPIFTVMIIVLGIIKQLLYYKNYNLPIKYFLGLGEIGLIISDDLLLIVPLLVTIIACSILFSQRKIVAVPDHNPLNTKTSKESTLKKSWNFIKSNLPYIYGICAGIVIFFLYSIYVMKLAAISIILFSIISIVIKLHLRNVLSYIAVSKKSIFVFITFVALTYFIILKTCIEIIEIDNYHRYSGTVIKTSDSTYISNDSSYFIGKTDKYVFIYNTKNAATDIIPTESVKLIIFKSK